MAIDQPITVYPKDRSNMKNGGHTAEESKNITETWEQKHGKMGRMSEKINLTDFLIDVNKNHNK